MPTHRLDVSTLLVTRHAGRNCTSILNCVQYFWVIRQDETDTQWPWPLNSTLNEHCELCVLWNLCNSLSCPWYSIRHLSHNGTHNVILTLWLWALTFWLRICEDISANFYRCCYNLQGPSSVTLHLRLGCVQGSWSCSLKMVWDPLRRRRIYLSQIHTYTFRLIHVSHGLPEKQ